MKWQDYEFDEAYRPSGFEEWSQEKVNVGYAFYLRDKYITDDTGLYEDTDEGTIHIFCPHFGETFEEDEKKVFGGKEAQSQCHCGSTMRLQASCPRERECEHTCKLLNALYPYYGVKKKDEFAFYQRTDRGMLLRAFTCTVTYPGERYELRRFGDTVYTEWLRVFYNADRTTEIYSRLRQSYSGNGGYFTCIGSEWTQKKKFQGYAGFTIYGEDLAGTLLEGFTKYFALMEGYITNETQRAVLLLALFRTPALKDVIKAGYLEVAKGYVKSLVTGQEKIGNVVRGRAKTITKFFGFELSKLDKLSAETKSKLTIRDIQTVKRMLNNRIAVTPETLAMCGNYRFNDLCVLYEGKALRRVIRYLRRQDTLFAQYLGNDEYYDYFSPTTEDDWVNYSAEYGSKASLYTMQVMNQVENPSYGRMNPYVTEDGYERVQGRLISGEGAMSINGDWFDNEMGGTIEQANSKEKIYESGMMKFPVISALSDQLSYWETILPGKDYQSACSDVPACTAGLEACDELLSLLVDYVDGGMQGELPSIQYSGQTITATEADAERVAEARSCYTSLGGGHTMVIPAYATAKELAKEFIRLCFSETGIDVFMDVSKGALLPVKYDMESWDGYSSATQFEKDIYDIAKDGTAIQHSSTVNWLVSGLPSPMSNVKFFQYKVTDSGYISPEKYFEQNSLDRAGFLDIMRQAGLL